MGIFASAGRFISTTFDQGTSLVESAGKTVGMATTYIDNRAIAQQITDAQIVKDSITETLTPIQQKLASDEDYKALYDQVSIDFDKLKAGK